MKTLSILATVIALVASPASGQAPAAPRSTAQVTIRAEVKNIRAEREKKSAEPDRKEKDKPKSETVTKSLEVKITAAQTVTGPLKMVTKWYGRDQSSKDHVVAKKHENEVALDAAQSATISIPQCEFTSTPSHSKKGSDGKSEKVDASGQTYSGYVIRVYQGETLVGEASNSTPLIKLAD